MKKYLAAGAVAIMVFAFSAFAASLNVSADNLQAGFTAEGDLECADSVDVRNYQIDEMGLLAEFDVVVTHGGACAGQTLNIAFFEGYADNSGNRTLLGGATILLSTNGGYPGIVPTAASPEVLRTDRIDTVAASITG